MGWKTINGRQYYYLSVRYGRMVRSEYGGGGEAGLLCALLQEDSRAERQERLDEEKATRERYDEVDRALDDLVKTAKAAAAEALKAAGYHQHHRGEWRRKRGKRRRESRPET